MEIRSKDFTLDYVCSDLVIENQTDSRAIVSQAESCICDSYAGMMVSDGRQNLW